MSSLKNLFIASDHAGFLLKQELLKRLPDLPWTDLGPSSSDRVDYPDFANLVAKEVASGNGLGILVCGSGQGMSMRANRHPGVRAALCWTPQIAELSRNHNDANVLCLGERVMDWDTCEETVKAFLEASFEGGRHQGRVEKIETRID